MNSQRAVIFAGAIILQALNPAYADDWTLDLALIAKVEANLVLPEGALPINEYSRYYFEISYTSPILRTKRWRPSGKTRVLGAKFLYTNSFPHRKEQSGAKIVKESDAPRVFDGGCGVINLEYDVDSGKVLALFCNGRI